MPGPLLHVGATVMCTHGGQAQPTTVQMTAPYVIAGCPFTTGTNPMPCVTGQWTVAATRVFSGGQPLVLMDSQSVCTPNGTPMLPTVAQMRVLGT